MLKAREAVQRMHEYHPPLARRVGLRLDFNENTEGCSPKVLERIRQITPEELARYPEREPVEAVAAQHLNLAPAQVILTNGVDEAVHLLCEAYLEPEHEVIVATPTFSMYEIYAEATGAKVVRAQCEGDFRFPLQQVLRADHAGDAADRRRQPQQSNRYRSDAKRSPGDVPGSARGRGPDRRGVLPLSRRNGNSRHRGDA